MSSFPNYFDLQVNGYGGVDFNSESLSAESLHAACAMLRAHGVGGIFATIITETLPMMCARLERLAMLRAADELVRDVIAGLHIEGPFLNGAPGYRGAHPVDAIRPAVLDEAKMLFDAGGELVRLFTLAPEKDNRLEVTRWLARQGVAVSAGHCDPTIDELRAAIDAGLTLITHLGNGCPPLMNRHDNIIQRALSLSDQLICCFIADGVHIPTFALKNYLRTAGLDRCCIVTDAISAAGLGAGTYRLSRWEVLVGNDLAARAPDGTHLVGSAMTMNQNRKNLRDMGLTEADCDRLLVINPRRVMSRAHKTVSSIS